MPQPQAQTTLQPGQMLVKRYRIEQLIGSGGYANVYRATDLTFGYERAIKEVNDTDPGVRTQFKLESELLINTKHPNVPHGFSLIEDRSRMYLVMEYIRGKDLEELLNESLVQHSRPLDEAQVLRWMIDVCGALDEMHNLRVPIIHRDIKPANIKVTPEGRPVLIDFGLAKLQRAGRPTMTAAQGVSPGFAPPEQYMAKGRTDARTDIYGLGATLYACLTGKDPPEAPSRLLAQTGAAGSGGANLIHPRKRNPRVSEATDRLVVKALELSPTHRQQTAAQMRDEMVAALRLLEDPAPLAEPARRTLAAPGPSESGTKRPALAGGGGLLKSTGKQPAVGSARPSAVPPAVSDPRTGRQMALAAESRTGQQPALARGGTGKQPAAAVDARSTGRQPAVLPRATGMMAAPAEAPMGAAATAVIPATAAGPVVAPAATKAASVPADTSGSWIHLGSTPLGGFGKFTLTFSVVEMLWGAIVLVLGAVAIGNQNKPFPVLQFALIWLAVVAVVSLVGGQALSRPIFRRGRIANLRRGFQGTGLFLYSVLVHAVAVWGAHIFATDQGNPTLAIVAFMLFGVNVFVVGVLSIVNVLA